MRGVDHRPFSWPLALAGALGAGLALAVQGVLRFWAGTPLAPEEMAQYVFRWIPMEGFRVFILLLGESAKWVAFAGMTALYVGAGALAAPLLRRASSSGAAAWVVAAAAVQAAALSGEASARGIAALGAYLLSTLFYAAVARQRRDLPFPDGRQLPGPSRHQAAPPPAPASPPAPLPRRRLLAMTGALAAGAAGAGAVAALLARVSGSLARAAAGLATTAAGAVSTAVAAVTARLDALRSLGLVPWVTPNRDFYHVSKNLFDPRVDGRRWRLRIDGLVDRPFELAYDDLAGLPGQVDQFTTLSCISNPIGGDLIGNARWHGVPLRLLLQRARLRPGVVDLRFEAADGYTDSVPLEKALHPETLLAWQMNGEPIPPDHGYPARLIVPGIYGMKNVKWITRIEAVNTDYKGFWEIRGWSDTAVTQTLSRIDVPRDGQTVGPGPVYVAGVAFAGDRGISAVEVSFDGGQTWHPAELEPAPNAMTWVRWLIEWKPAAPGRYELAVRASDGRGQLQDPRPAAPLPEGATGLHRIQVTWRT